MSQLFNALTIISCTTLVCAATPNFAQTNSPSMFNYSSSGKCRVVNVSQAPYSKVLSRYVAGDPADRILEWFNTAISSAKVNQTQAKKLAAEMSKLAKGGAFTKLDWSGNGGSPAHWQTNILKNVAIAVNVLDHRNAWSGTQRRDVVEWGDTLWKNSHYTRWGRSQSDRWPDTVATAAAAYVLWGVVAPNKKAYREGKSDFRRVAKRLKTQGGTGEFYSGMSKYSKDMAERGWHARLEDKMLGDLVIAAHAAKRAGEDLFQKSGGKVNLYSSIVGWQYTLFGSGGSAVRGMDMSFLTISGAERSWSWTEYFIANYPNDEATQTLRNRSRKIAQRDRFGYVGKATGPSTCLFR